MSKEKQEQKSGIFDALGTIKKFHPVALILLIALMWIGVTVYNLDIALEKKIVPLALSGSLYVIASFFEFYRIDKQKDMKEEAWRKRVLS